MISRLIFLGLILSATMPSVAATREFSFDLWDWTRPCRDLPTFKIWAEDLKKIGVNRLEISAPWNSLEPRPGEYDMAFIADRAAIAKSLGLGMRVRINSYYAGATPPWLTCDRWLDVHGNIPASVGAIPSITDPRFVDRYAALCTHIAKTFKGEDIFYSPFVGVHAELKWSDWWSYDASSLAKWRAIYPDAPQTPPIPPATNRSPDLDPLHREWIDFRENCWREMVTRFNAAIRAGDPDARTSAPLGESFRQQSAQMSNLDYFGLSRGMNQVVHSYDFFWHKRDEPWQAGAAVASFRDITQLPIVFEFDGPDLTQKLGYTEEKLLKIADAALAEGAGLKAANYSYSDRLPSSWPVLIEMGKRLAAAPEIVEPPRDRTMLLFISKWSNYCYREKTEWLHEAQFGAWKKLRDRDIPVRIICEDNLDEDLTGYRGVEIAPFCSPDLMPPEAREKLRKLTT